MKKRHDEFTSKNTSKNTSSSLRFTEISFRSCHISESFLKRGKIYSPVNTQKLSSH